MFIVTLTNNGQQFWLRGTTWAFGRERAQEFTSLGRAQEALLTAKPFMKAGLYKKAACVESDPRGTAVYLTRSQLEWLQNTCITNQEISAIIRNVLVDTTK